MADDSELRIKLIANADSFIKNIQSASGSWSGLIKTMSGGNVAMLAAGGAIIAAGAALWGLVKSAADAADKMNEMSEKTGVSVESLSLLKYAAEQSDTDIESLANGLKFLKKNLIDAQKPTSEQSAIFKGLSLDTVDLTGKTRSQTDVMLDLADRFKDMQDPALKTKVALELFGKAGVDLIPFLNNGSDGIAELTKKAESLGLMLSGETAKAGNEFNDDLNTLYSTIKKVGLVIGGELLGPIGDLIKFINDTAIPILKTLGTGVFAALTTIVYGLAEGFMSVYGAVAKITDAIGITKGAADGADAIIKGLQASSSEWGKKADDAFKSIITGAPLATKGLTDTRTETQKNKKVTDEHIASILNKKDIDAAAAKVAKDTADKEAEGLKVVKKGIDNILDAKIASKDYDEEYFKYYAEQLKLEGKNEEQVAAIIKAERKKLNDELEDDYEKMLDEKHAADKSDLQKYLMVKEAYNQYDEDYFVNYRKLLETQSSDSDEINIGMANEAIRVGHLRADEEVEIVVTTNDLIKTAVQGVADSIKSIWNGTTTSFQDIWHGALDIFVDVMAQMAINAKFVWAEMQIGMAAATAGISLVIGMLSMALGGKGKSIKVEPVTVRLKKVFDDFVKDFKGAMGEFQERLFPKKDEVTRERKEMERVIQGLNILKDALTTVIFTDYEGMESTNIKGLTRTTFNEINAILREMGIGAFKFISQSTSGINQRVVELAKKLSENLTDITSLMVERFNKIKDIVGDILDLYKRQGEFTKDMDKTILDVQRSLLAPEKMFTAQLGDVELLKTAVAGAVGEEQVSLVGELKAAYLTAWESAQGIFGEDADKLAEWQEFTVEGLEGLKITGQSAYDKLIDINLDMLGLQRSGVDLQSQMTSYLSSLDTNIVSTLKAIEEIGTTNTATDSQLSLLTTTLASLFDIPMMAAGGIVTRPTLAMIGESGSEAVIPLNKLNQVAGGGTATFNMSFPNVTDLKGMTVGQAENLIKNVFSQAAENLNRRGYRWPMQPRTA